MNPARLAKSSAVGASRFFLWVSISSGTPSFKIVREVRAFIKKSRPQILHTHLYHPNLYGRLASLGLGLKGIVASIHNAYTRVKFHRCLWNNLLGRITDRILVSSSQVYQDVRRYDRIPAAKILLMPYGIRLAELDLPLDKAAAKAELGISGFCLGTIGRLEEQKGQEFLLAAVPEISRHIPDLTVLVVGDGRLRSRLEESGPHPGNRRTSSISWAPGGTCRYCTAPWTSLSCLPSGRACRWSS